MIGSHSSVLPLPPVGHSFAHPIEAWTDEMSKDYRSASPLPATADMMIATRQATIEIPVEMGALKSFIQQCKGQDPQKRQVELPITASATIGKLGKAVFCFLA